MDEIIRKKKRVLHIVRLVDQDNDNFFGKLLLFYLELPNFEKEIEDLETDLEMWLYILRNITKKEECPEAFRNHPIFKKIFEVAEMANLSPQQYKKYLESMRMYDSLANTRETYIEEKKREVKKVRKQAYEEKLSIAKSLLDVGMLPILVARHTKLPLKVVQQLQRTL